MPRDLSHSSIDSWRNESLHASIEWSNRSRAYDLSGRVLLKVKAQLLSEHLRDMSEHLQDVSMSEVMA